MFEKILFATTGSPTCDAAANVAFDLAEKYKSNLKVFHVYGYPTRGYSPYVFDVRTGAAENADKGKTRKRRGRDSNPRYPMGTQHFQCCTFGRSVTSPCGRDYTRKQRPQTTVSAVGNDPFCRRMRNTLI